MILNQVERGIIDVIEAFNDELIVEPPLRNVRFVGESKSAPYIYSFVDNYKISGEDELKNTTEKENEDNNGRDEDFIIRDEEYKAKFKP
ncbi:hypothetical protein Hanom_Chr01g00085251 [Helianthus anomalus]